MGDRRDCPAAVTIRVRTAAGRTRSSWPVLDAPFRHTRSVRERSGSGGCGRAGNPEALIVVPIIGLVPVAVGRAEVPRIVVPGAAAVDACERGPARLPLRAAWAIAEERI